MCTLIFINYSIVLRGDTFIVNMSLWVFATAVGVFRPHSKHTNWRYFLVERIVVVHWNLTQARRASNWQDLVVGTKTNVCIVRLLYLLYWHFIFHTHFIFLLFNYKWKLNMFPHLGRFPEICTVTKKWPGYQSFKLVLFQSSIWIGLGSRLMKQKRGNLVSIFTKSYDDFESCLSHHDKTIFGLLSTKNCSLWTPIPSKTWLKI